MDITGKPGRPLSIRSTRVSSPLTSLMLSPQFFEELKVYSGFREEDAIILRQVHEAVRARFPAIVDDFYTRILEHEATRRIFTGSAQVERLKGTLQEWLDEVFLGPHDAAYFHKRVRIGEAHARVGLRQPYVFGAMSRIRGLLDDEIERVTRGDAQKRRRTLSALAKVLDIDLALIAGSYHEAEKYQDLVERAPDMIHQVDGEGRIVDVNQTEVDRLGYSREKLLSMRLEDIVHPRDREILREHLKRVFETGKGRCEVCLVDSRGEQVEVEIHATGKPDDITGAIVRTRAYVRDITERKAMAAALLESEGRFKAFMDNSPTVAFMKDDKGRLVYVNREFERVFQLAPGDWWMKTDFDLWPEETAQRLRENDAAVKAAGKCIETTEMVPGPDKRPHDWLVLKFPWADGSGNRFLGGMAVDVTERNRMQKELVERESLTRLGELVAVVAHEVKNPLAGIRGAIQVIGERLASGREEEPVIQEIIGRIDSLNDIVNDLLLFARPRLPAVRPVPMQALLEATASLLLKDPQLQGVDVRISGPELSVPADADLLKPVILNLLINAAQAMGGKGKISVNFGREGGHCRIEVADHGPGIPREIRDRIFEPFFSTKRRGTGLGLPISRRVIEAHGGEIAVACPAAGGTTVVIKLPLEG